MGSRLKGSVDWLSAAAIIFYSALLLGFLGLMASGALIFWANRAAIQSGEGKLFDAAVKEREAVWG